MIVFYCKGLYVAQGIIRRGTKMSKSNIIKDQVDRVGNVEWTTVEREKKKEGERKSKQERDGGKEIEID